ncbi:hypothetical protein DsansV1_C02g0015591 [Dioscorea sansibarensis]
MNYKRDISLNSCKVLVKFNFSTCHVVIFILCLLVVVTICLVDKFIFCRSL